MSVNSSFSYLGSRLGLGKSMLNGHSPVWNLYTDGKPDLDLPVAQKNRRGRRQSVLILCFASCLAQTKLWLPSHNPKGTANDADDAFQVATLTSTTTSASYRRIAPPRNWSNLLARRYFVIKHSR